MTARDELDALLNATPNERLPDFVGELEAVKTRALLRLQPPTIARGPRRVINWIEVDVAAADVAGLPMTTPSEMKRSRATIYRWADGRSWATRPSRRRLLIDEDAFRAWLESR